MRTTNAQLIAQLTKTEFYINTQQLKSTPGVHASTKDYVLRFSVKLPQDIEIA